MKKSEVLEKVNALGDDADLIIRTQDEEKAFLENHKKLVSSQQFEEWKTSEVKSWHDKLEADVEEVTGLRKDSGEKSYNYNKRVLKQLKDQAARAEELERKLKDNAGDETLKAELASVQNKHKALKDEYEAKLAQAEQRVHAVKIESEIDRAMYGMKFATNIPDQLREVYIEKVKSELLKTAKYDNGVLVFTDEKGEIIRDAGTLKPRPASDLIQEKLKPIIDEGVQRKGTGSKADDEKGTGEYQPSASITKKAQLADDMLKFGLKRGTKEWMEVYNKHAIKLKD